VAVELNGTEVVMYAPSFDECRLVVPDQAVHEGCQPHREPFGYEFAKAVNKANWPVIPEASQSVFRRNTIFSSLAATKA
jgi:hypothetical protein